MSTRFEQVVEALLRQILAEIQLSNQSLDAIEEDVDEIEEDVDQMVPTPGAVSATLVLIPNP